MKLKLSAVLMLSLMLVFAFSGLAAARSSYLTDFNNLYSTANTKLNSCDTCHVPGGKTRNPYGADMDVQLLAGKSSPDSLVAIEPLDSDNDGYTNITEINALTFPGDPNDKPGAACTDADGDGYAVEGGTCGAVDCSDNNAAVNPGALEICNNNIDDDCDGLVDCADSNCGGVPACAGICVPTARSERKACADAIDNDCDGAMDCADSDCAHNRACR